LGDQNILTEAAAAATQQPPQPRQLLLQPQKYFSRTQKSYLEYNIHHQNQTTAFVSITTAVVTATTAVNTATTAAELPVLAAEVATLASYGWDNPSHFITTAKTAAARSSCTLS
jgi:hypothetical protein